ncbi:hypothetical protein OCGS_0670 [Oceaniovalibus guishaninsula JLT2003]|uniref:Adenylosuccinate lyase n=1 Tax=Oceaniovalibus guishaninsula JLT2003 TaxID=1231392 RepID=K2HFE6_9RHOB|nr:hypothetical protein [Oceaniovalibus guishaninsula]EKE45192.1 hypothetical protein OCGS_0670 [Oceaniovalibus guishaninsula JLT2003]
MKSTILAIAVMLAPSLALAEGCNWMKQTTAKACAEGTALDAATGTCQPVVNS